MMQDSVLTMCQKNYTEYQKWLTSFIPAKVEVIETNQVNNTFENNLEHPPKALFAIDLLKSTSNDEYLFSTPPKNFMTAILNHFDRVFEDLSRIPDIEHKV